MTTNIVNIALSGLKAAQAGLAITANNISNQSTPGYSRQDLVQQASFSNFSGSGYFGQGVDVVTVRRAYSDFLTAQASQSASDLNYYSTYSDQMSGLMNRLGDVDTGINKSFNDLFAAMSNFGQRPSEAAPRQGAYTAAHSTAARFRTLSQDLADMRVGADQQIAATTGQINAMVQGIASYNEKIGAALSAGGGSVPNELLDQRDTLLRDLGVLVGITTSTQGDAVNVFLSSGQPLVVGASVSELKFVQSTGSASGSSISLVGSGRGIRLRESDMDGGRIGALLQFRDKELANAESELGRLAIGMVSIYNQQQQFGLDSEGHAGAPLFKLGSPRIETSPSNVGDASLIVAVADSRSLTGDDYELTRSGSDYVLTRAGTDTVVGTYASLPQSVEGITITLQSGEMADGDSMHIDVTGQAASGVEVILSGPAGLAAAAPMQLDTASTNSGTGMVSRLHSVESDSVDYTESIDVVFTSATAFELRNAAGDVVDSGSIEPPSTTISHNGWALELNGTPAAGDTFTVRASPGDPSGDSRNAVALASLSTVKLPGGSNLTDSYASLVSNIGTRAASINVSREAQQASYNQAVDAEQSAVGVSVEEEGARLIRYQQAYAAAGKVLAMASQLFDELVASMA